MKTLLDKLLRIPPLYGRFLNTLSFLEYIGARKILKSQRQETLTLEILNHASEEIRHARVLKRLALKVAPTLCQDYAPSALLCGNEARAYIQAIDQMAAVLTNQDPWRTYLYATLAIEERALAFYAACETVLETQGQSAFRGILHEEQQHLAQIRMLLATDSHYDSHYAQMQSLERQVFEALMAAMTTEIAHYESQDHQNSQKNEIHA